MMFYVTYSIAKSFQGFHLLKIIHGSYFVRERERERNLQIVTFFHVKIYVKSFLLFGDAKSGSYLPFKWKINL